MFEQFEKMMSYDVAKNNACIEIEFCIDDDPEYTSCWLGKTTCRETQRTVYWYGLVADASQAFDFNLMQPFIDAPVFHGKSIKEVWETVTLISIDGCDVEQRLAQYLCLEVDPIRGPAQLID